MKLEVHERLMCLEMLPKEGDYAAMKAIRQAREIIGFTTDEKNFYQLKDVGGKIEWSTQAAADRVADIPMTEFITNLIRDNLAKLNHQHKLRDEHLSLYEKLIAMYK